MRQSIRCCSSLFALALIALCTTCNSAPPPPTKTPRFNHERAYVHLKTLCELGPRNSGSEGKRAAAELIKRTLIDAGVEVAVHEFEYKSAKFTNIIGRIRSQDPRRVLIGTHYDTHSNAEKDPVPRRQSQPITKAGEWHISTTCYEVSTVRGSGWVRSVEPG